MLLYWGMFTAGFSIGAIFAYITFASKNTQEDQAIDREEINSADNTFENLTLPSSQNHPDYSTQTNQITQINTKRLTVN